MCVCVGGFVSTLWDRSDPSFSLPFKITADLIPEFQVPPGALETLDSSQTFFENIPGLFRVERVQVVLERADRWTDPELCACTLVPAPDRLGLTRSDIQAAECRLGD